MSAACPACGAQLPDEPSLRGPDRLFGTPGMFEVHVCADCGTGRTLPVVSTEDLAAFYPATYDAYRLPDNPALRALATLLFRLRYRRARKAPPLGALRAERPGRLLDVGSGRGDLGVVLREQGWDVTGLEPSEDACEEARQRGVHSVRGTLTTAAEELSGGFDAVVFQHSLEHVSEPAADLAAARGLLRSGGLLLVSVPNFGSWQRHRFGSRWFHLDGLAGSLQYRMFGRRRFDHGLGKYGMVAATLGLAPLGAAANAFAGDGDILTAAAVKPEGEE